MSKENLKQNVGHVGAGPVSARKNHRGITLIALIITIIVMLILVGVTVTVALNGGLFRTAKQATGDTESEINAEQKLANGKIKVGNNLYASYQDYLDGIVLEQGISLQEKLTLEIEEGYDIETSTPVTTELEATLNEIEGNITWTSDDEDIATVTGEGTKVTITAISQGSATISATCEYEGETYTAECTVKVRFPITIARGDFVEYGVAYKDAARTTYNYSTTNGWRLLDYTYDAENKTYSNVKLISTGIPAKLYYDYQNTTNNDWWVEEETVEDENAPSLSKFRQLLGGEEYYTFYTGEETYYSLQVAAGLYYNFGDIKFAYATGNRGANLGQFESISVYSGTKEEPVITTYDANKTDEKTGNELFKVREDATVRLLTLPELNKLLGRSTGADDNVDKTNQKISTTDDNIGLYILGRLKNLEDMTSYTYSTDSYGTNYFWLASPMPSSTNHNRVQTLPFDNGGTFGGYGMYSGLQSIRPVICISSTIQFIDSNDDGTLEIKVVQ